MSTCGVHKHALQVVRGGKTHDAPIRAAGVLHILISDFLHLLSTFQVPSAASERQRMFGTFITDPDEIEPRSVLSFALAIGRHFIVVDHPGHTKREAIELAGEHLLRR
jgi:hypothetical protein